MKKIDFISIVVFAIALLIIGACDKNQVLINKVEGTYQIEKIVTINDAGEHSEVAYTKSIMFFEKCKLRKKDVAVCAGFYDIEGQNRILFEYYAEKDDGKNKMRINIGDLSLTPYFAGNYEIETLTDRIVTLARTDDTPAGMRVNLRIFLRK